MDFLFLEFYIQRNHTIPKPKTTQMETAEVVNANYGNYVLGYGDTIGVSGAYDSAGIKNYGIPNTLNFQKIK